MRLSSSPLALAALVALLGWGFLDDLFGGDRAVRPPDARAVGAILEATVAGRAGSPPVHPETAALYQTEPGARWTAPDALPSALALLHIAETEGIEGVGAPEAVRSFRLLDAAEQAWATLDANARDTLADPRPARVAALDLALTDGLLRYGAALRGSRVDAAALYPGVWFPARRDTSGAQWVALVGAVRDGDASQAARALSALRPRHEGYRLLREALARLSAPLPPVPAGADLRAGERSVRVPHLRGRLAAFGYLPDSVDAWGHPDPFLLDRPLARALGRFQADHGLAADGVLDVAATAALNPALDSIRAEIALNLERWRWLPDDLGDRFVWVNLPAFELHVRERPRPGGPYTDSLRMPVNIGNAQTTGWTTPVITDSVHTVEFQPAWYVPASLAASNIFPMARADSLALWRSGIEATLNGRPVDTRLVQWDSVSTAGFRFVQRPGPGNPLGRVKFLMHNPYAILIHDTNKRWTLEDGVGSSMSSGCVQAGRPAALAAYLLRSVNGWKEGEAETAYQRGPRRGVRLERPVRTHFVYFTAAVDGRGALRLYADPYGYNRRLAARLDARPAPTPASGRTTARAGA